MRKAFPLLFFLLLGLLTFWKPIFHSEYTLLSGGDICAQTFPWFNVASHWLKKGVLPLWDPYVYAGKADLGELGPGLLYPVNWIFMLLPSPGGGINTIGLEFLIILDYVFMGFFCYLLARAFGLRTVGALMAGTVFAIGGYCVQLYAWVNIISGVVWMPLVFFLFCRALAAEDRRGRRRFLLGAGLCLALSFAAGHHAAAIHTGVLLFLYTIFRIVWRRHEFSGRTSLAWLGCLAAVSVTAGLIAAAQWLPSLEWAQKVWRWIGESDPLKGGQAIPYSILQRTGNLNPQDVLSLVIPYMATSANLYVGTAVLFFAAVGMLFARGEGAGFVRFASILYFFLSWGQLFAPHGWLNTFVPGVWFAREVYLYLVPFQLCLAILAGFGLDYMITEYSTEPRRIFGVFIRRTGWAMAMLVLITGVLLFSANLLNGLPWDNAIVKRCFAFAAYLTVLGILLFFLHTKRIGAQAFGFLALTLAVVDLTSQLSTSIRSSQAPRGTPNPAAGEYWKIPPEGEFLKDLRKNEVFRVDNPAQIFPPNFGDAWLIEETMGHGATARVDYLDFRGSGWGPASNVSALLNARYLVSRIPVSWMTKVFESSAGVYRNPRATPRAFAVSRYKCLENDQEILDWIQSPFFSPSGTVALRRGDLARLPSSFLQAMIKEDEGVRVRPLSYPTAAEKEIERTHDEEARYRLNLYHAPWGWSVGDEMTWEVRPETSIEHAYLVLGYYSTGARSSTLTMKVGRLGVERTIPIVLPGLGAASEAGVLHEYALDCGPLSAEDYRFSLVKTETCAALIDSLRISATRPVPGDSSAGTVMLTLFKPNRLRIEAELKRPSFVVVSELYYPGWEASVDGKPAILIEGDYILRAIPVDAGRHEIMLRFRSKTFQWGLVISLAALAGMALLMIFRL